MRSTALALVIGLSFASTALGAAAAPDVAKQLVQTTMSRERYADMMRMINQQVVATMKAQLGKAAEEDPTLIERIARATQQLFTYDEYVQQSSAITAKHFTVPEMRELLQFYATPIGKKSLEKMPLVMSESMAWSVEVVKARLPEALERVLEQEPRAR